MQIKKPNLIIMDDLETDEDIETDMLAFGEAMHKKYVEKNLLIDAMCVEKLNNYIRELRIELAVYRAMERKDDSA